MKLQNICQEKSIFIQFYKKKIKGLAFYSQGFREQKDL